MAVTTNLSVFDAADSNSNWSELSGHSSGGAPAATSENYWQNGTAVDQNTNQASGTSAGMYCQTTAPTWTTSSNWVFLVWSKYDAGTNINTWANGGFSIGVGSSGSDFNWYNAMGSDFGTYPSGGWQSTAIDPEATQDSTEGTPSGSYAAIGFLPNTLAKVTKGSPIVADIIRYGRGDILVTGTETFSSIATADNTSTVRWGLFYPQSGSYLWKGLLQLGTSGTSLSMTDSNVNIRIEDTPRVLSGFNVIEVNNSSTSITWNTVSITGVQTSITGSAPVSKGDFVVNAGDIDWSGCTFTDMGTFTFLNATSSVDACTFRRCEQLDLNAMDLTNCLITDSQATGSAVLADSTGEVTNCDFIGDGSTTPAHAVDFGSVTGGGSAGSPVTINWTSTLDNGANQSVWEGSTQSSTAGTQGTANSAVTLNVAASTYVKIAVGSGATIPTVQNTGTGFLEISANEVTLTITVVDIDTGSPIEGAMVYVYDTLTPATEYIAKVETNSSGQVTHTTSLGSARSITGRARAATPASKAYSKYYKTAPIAGTYSNTADTNITVQMIPDE